MTTPPSASVTFPSWSSLHPELVVSQLTDLLSRHREQLQFLLSSDFTPTWQNLLQPLEALSDELHQFWAPIRHLHAVANTPALREAYKACLPLLSEHEMAIMQHAGLYQAIQSIADSPAMQQLDAAQQAVIHHKLRDFRLAGVHLSEPDRQHFADLNKKLSELTRQFEENVLDATQSWHHCVTDRAELAGIPEHAMAAARQAAEQQGLTGWLWTLEMPSYLAVMEHADNRQLRRKVYTAFVTRASDQGEQAGRWDNSDVMDAILQTRLEMAKLLGFQNYAEYSLATKMAKSAESVLDFLQQLAAASLSQARAEFAELTRFAQAEQGIVELEAWDIAYYSEKLRQQAYALAKEDFRPYFPEPVVWTGLFTIVEHLYGLKIRELSEKEVWKPEVKLFELRDAQNQLRGHLYADLYARSGKRDGAWMDDCRIRRQLPDGSIQAPIALITCNFSAPLGEAPSLFTHDEVTTLFHEFGHALQHLLSQVDYLDVSGINGVPWDAVEIASQFMESWCWEKAGLDLIARHYQTGEPLPEEWFQKLLKAKNFQSAMQMVRQLQFALFDFRLHTEYVPGQTGQIQRILDEVRSAYSVFSVPDFNRFQHAFSHIFAGGYAAGYYSYKWAEVLACDAFSRFTENGIFDRKTGEDFLQTFLESGGVVDPMELFIRFRGRPPEISALLQYNGIAPEARS